MRVRVRVCGAANTAPLSLTSFLFGARAWKREKKKGGGRREREKERTRERASAREAKNGALAASITSLELISNRRAV